MDPRFRNIPLQHINMTEPLLTALDHVRRTVNGRTQRAERSDIGQFLTPVLIARFMASMFAPNRLDHVRILDAGAGAGVLFSAYVETLVAEGRRPLSIEVVAYENDGGILPELAQTMARCEAACGKVGVAFHGETRVEDFVAAAIARTEEGLFASPGERFTHTILNPPYKKINGQSATRKRLDAAGMEVSNLYAAFVWLAARLLAPGGELAAITPRSFCNGPYFRRFRFALLEMMSLRRIVAAVYDPHRIASPLVGFENHLNYFHAGGNGMPEQMAKGLALYLNSSLFDCHFRLFSGHTQVNATDLRKMTYPSRDQLMRLGLHVQDRMPDQETIDKILERECEKP